MWNGDDPIRRSTRGMDQSGLGGRGAAKARALDTPMERTIYRERPSMQILVVAANIQIRTLKVEEGKDSMKMALAHGQGKLAKWICNFGKKISSEGWVTLVVTCTHRLVNISHGMRISALACAHKPGDIGRGMSKLVRRSLPASSVAYTRRSTDVERGLPALSVACTHRSGDIERGLPASSVACTHRSADVGRGLAASPVACTYRSTDVELSLPTLFVPCTH
ncbi:hypothetical protein H5410_022145 [Solanum commersonii]|uniref:Uncharacterized protein n=1 Tax=Solanum commersonii TaxID=4109 RepID=A0A9J5ZGB0_SOLCO|nr:hypothetical protein H5410_022145 [Solanum commersonii]